MCGRNVSVELLMVPSIHVSVGIFRWKCLSVPIEQNIDGAIIQGDPEIMSPANALSCIVIVVNQTS